MKYYDIDDIKRANADAGGCWFSRGALRFFNSRIGRTVYQGPGGIYFTSSETPDLDRVQRKYCVRKFDPATGRISTVGEFREYETAAAARAAAKRAAGGVR